MAGGCESGWLAGWLVEVLVGWRPLGAWLLLGGLGGWSLELSAFAVSLRGTPVSIPYSPFSSYSLPSPPLPPTICTALASIAICSGVDAPCLPQLHQLCPASVASCIQQLQRKSSRPLPWLGRATLFAAWRPMTADRLVELSLGGNRPVPANVRSLLCYVKEPCSACHHIYRCAAAVFVPLCTTSLPLPLPSPSPSPSPPSSPPTPRPTLPLTSYHGAQQRLRKLHRRRPRKGPQ